MVSSASDGVRTSGADSATSASGAGPISCLLHFITQYDTRFSTLTELLLPMGQNVGSEGGCSLQGKGPKAASPSLGLAAAYDSFSSITRTLNVSSFPEILQRSIHILLLPVSSNVSICREHHRCFTYYAAEPPRASSSDRRLVNDFAWVSREE